jgi:TonB family protein
MKHILLFILMVMSVASAEAQFFNYRREVRPREEQIAPKFKDDKAGLERFMKKHFKNPSVIDRRVSGDVVVDVIINVKGKVEDCRVVRSVAADYDKEAVRVTKKMKFKPAMQGKKKVKSRYRLTYPIRRGRLSFITLKTVDV